MRELEDAPPVSENLPRDILSLITNDEVNTVINKIQEDYFYWDKVKYLKLPDGFNIKEVWAVAKIRRLSTPFSITFGRYKFIWNTGSKIQGLLHFLDLNVGGSLQSASSLSKADKHRYLLSSIMEEAIASSQIEGAVTTRKHAKEMLRKNMKPRNKSEQMILNNYITIQKILQLKSSALTKESLLAVHKLVTTNTMPSLLDEGAFRQDNEVKVVDAIDGTIVHIPPPVTEIDGLLNDLFEFFNNDIDDGVFKHPILKACIIHFIIGFIHPFADGNGRTARALFYWYLLKNDYWLIEYLSISRLILRSKTQYARAFQYTEKDDNDLTYFMMYNLKAMKLAFDELRAYIKRKTEESKQVIAHFEVKDITHRQSQILDWFYTQPNLLLTVNEAQNKLGISNGSARTDLTELVRKGYLSISEIDKKSKGYIRGERFNTLPNRTVNKYGIKTNLNQQSLFD